MLSDRDRAVLEFEASWWKQPGPKEEAVHEQLGMSATRYYQVLRRLMEDPEAIAHDPLTIRRLRRLRDVSRRERLHDRLGGQQPPGG